MDQEYLNLKRRLLATFSSTDLLEEIVSRANSAFYDLQDYCKSDIKNITDYYSHPLSKTHKNEIAKLKKEIKNLQVGKTQCNSLVKTLTKILAQIEKHGY